jgi:cytokinin trans-hydroxylase
MAIATVVVTAIASAAVALLLRAVWVTLSCYFLTPIRIRRAMAAQGVYGPPPRPLVGNLREVSAFVAKATAGDMPFLSHDIVGRLMPHYVHWSGIYGENFKKTISPHCAAGRRTNVVIDRGNSAFQGSSSCTGTGASLGCA